MEIKLSKDTDALACLIYKAFILKIKQGKTKSDAKYIGGSDELFEFLEHKLSKDDIIDCCNELKENNFLECIYSEDRIYSAEITNNLIVFMENRFANGINSLLDYLAKIKSIIPFI